MAPLPWPAPRVGRRFGMRPSIAREAASSLLSSTNTSISVLSASHSSSTARSRARREALSSSAFSSFVSSAFRSRRSASFFCVSASSFAFASSTRPEPSAPYSFSRRRFICEQSATRSAHEQGGVRDWALTRWERQGARPRWRTAASHPPPPRPPSRRPRRPRRPLPPPLRRAPRAPPWRRSHHEPVAADVLKRPCSLVTASHGRHVPTSGRASQGGYHGARTELPAR